MPARYPALWLGSMSCSQLFNLGGGGQILRYDWSQLLVTTWDLATGF